MWNSKQDMIDSEELGIRLFGPESIKVRDQCVRSYQFKAFLTALPLFSFSYRSSIPKINVIDCKTEGKAEAYAFVPSMFSQSSLSGNILMFEDLNVIQMSINKTNSQWDDWLIIWWNN